VTFGAGPEEDIREEDIGNHDKDRNEDGRINDEMGEEEEEKVMTMSIRPLPNRKYCAEVDGLGGTTLNKLLSNSDSADLYHKARDFLIDHGSWINIEGRSARLIQENWLTCSEDGRSGI
jgi:hypothetical protein